MALNEGLAWPNPVPNSLESNAKVVNAFLNQKADKRLLKSGLKLYKFNESGRELVGADGRISPWWFPVEPLGDFDNGLDTVLKFAKTVGVSSTEYARLIAAVTTEWNAMDVIMKTELRQPVWAFYGQCRNQPKTEKSKVNLTGRAYQLFIPNLTLDYIRLDGKPVKAP